jgi:hypothetical protein
MTVGGLIHNLTVFADFYERASADIDRDANADVMQRDFRATVAIDRIRAYVLAKYGADLTIGTARRLLGDLVRECSLTVKAAEELPLEDAMDKLAGRQESDGAQATTEAARNKLTLIRDFNGGLQGQGNADKPERQSDPAPAVTTEPAPTGFLGGADLADALGVHPSQRDAFFKQLERKRTSLGDECWQEVSNRRANNPRFQYRVDSQKLRELAEAYKTPKPD